MPQSSRLFIAIVLACSISACGDSSTSTSAGSSDAADPASDQAATPAQVVAAPPMTPPVEPVVEPAPTPAPTTPVVASPPSQEAAPENVVDAAPASGPTQHVVKGVVTQWSPMVLFIEPGDQVVFKQMAGHDSATIDGMIPENGTSWQSKLGQEGFSVTITEPGVYIYKCTPHVSLGMIGAIVVGDTPPANLAALEANPQNKGMIGRAIRKLKKALEAQPAG